jgi:hypothetical protein
MARPITPATELPDRCDKCDSPMRLERMDVPRAEVDDQPAEVPVCTNPECPTNSPSQTATDEL